MTENDINYLFVILILPSLFGLTLVGEGLNKIIKSESAGWLSIGFGTLFIGLIIFVYLFISGQIEMLIPTP